MRSASLARTKETAATSAAGGDAWLAIARLVRPRGRKGELVAEVLTDFPERFSALRRVYVQGSGEGVPTPAEISNAWWHDGSLVLHLAGLDTITQAEALRGRLLVVPREERVSLDEGRYYWWELMGCEVWQARDRRGPVKLGTVAGIEPTGGVDLLRVERPGARGGEVLIPLARAICRDIDLPGRRIVIEPPEGLLELNEEPDGVA